MAMNYQNFASLGVNLNRQKYGPLDISNVFTSAADLKYYLTKGTFTTGVSEYWYKNANEKIVPYPYEGQVLATVIDGVVNVYALSLDAEGNFQTQEIGAKVEVDGTTIVKDAEGKLSVVAPVNPNSEKTYNFSYANGVYSWVEVDTTTAAGQAQDISALKIRTAALEETVNGKGEGEEHVAGLVEKVAANTQAIADEVAAREAAIGKATEGEVAATGVYAAIEAAEARAKAYADANDADTIYDDSDLQTRVKALEDEERYDDTELSNRVTTLEGVVGDAESGLVKGLADEITRAKEAEKTLDDAIKAIDFVDADELADAIKDFATVGYVDGEIDKIEEAISNLNHFTATVVGSIDEVQDVGVLYLIKDETVTGVDKYNEYIVVDGAPILIGDTTTDLSNYYNKTEVDGKVEALEGAIANEVEARETLAGRVKTLEEKPFDTYATKTEVETVDGKFANYTTTADLNNALAGKVDNSTFETFKGENTTAINNAKDAAIAAAKTETDTQVSALQTAVAKDYATKAELTEAVEGIENDLLAYAKTEDINKELAKKIETGSIAHSSESLAEGVTVVGTKLNIVVDAYTKQEVRDYVADVIEDMTGGESAADVLLALNNHIDTYTEKVGQLDAKDATQDTDIAAAKTQADKGVADAAKVAADLITANANITENTRQISVVDGKITTVNNTLTEKITALESKDTTIDGNITALQTLTTGHTSTITEHGTKIAALEDKDTEFETRIQANTDKFANYYTSTQVDAKVITSGEVVRGTADSVSIANNKITVTVNSYTKEEVDTKLANLDQTEINNAIAANAAAIATLNGADAGKSARAIAKEEVELIVGAAPEALDTLEEVASWIANDETGAAAMAADINAHKAILAGFGTADGEVATVAAAIQAAKEEAIAAIPALEVATAEKLGGVKSATGDNKVSVAEDGVMSVAAVNVNTLTQTEGDVLILNGGTASN